GIPTTVIKIWTSISTANNSSIRPNNPSGARRNRRQPMISQPEKRPEVAGESRAGAVQAVSVLVIGSLLGIVASSIPIDARGIRNLTGGASGASSHEG